MSFARTRSMTFATSRSTILTRTFRSSWWNTLMSSNRFRNSGLNTRFDSSRILSAHRLVGLVAGDGAKAQSRLAFDQLGAHVRGHDDNRVPEIDLLAEAIGDFALFQNLEEQMHHIRVSLFDLIEEHYRVGVTSNRFGKLTAFFVSHVTGRRTDQARRSEFFCVFGHVDLNQSVGVAKHELGQRTSQKRFSNPGWTHKDE